MQFTTRIFCWFFMLAFPLWVYAQPPINSVNGKSVGKKKVEKKKTEEEEDELMGDIDMGMDDEGGDDLNLDMEEDDNDELADTDEDFGDEEEGSFTSLDALEIDETSSLSELDVLSTGETVSEHAEENEDNFVLAANIRPMAIREERSSFPAEIILPKKENYTQPVHTTVEGTPPSNQIISQTPTASEANTPEIDYDFEDNDWSPVFYPIPNDRVANVTLKDVRPLKEANKESASDAYPWISADGLRLFFTQNDGERDHLYWMSREDISKDFGEKQEVAILSNQKGGRFSCWLTNNELEIYYIVRTSDPRGSLFHATRETWDDAFTNEKQVALDGSFDGFISSPSLSPDGHYLYLYNGGKKRKIVTFRKISDDNFTFESELATPFELGPSQINKEGNHFLIGMGRKFTHDCSLYWVEGNGSNFDKVTYLQLQSSQMRLRMDQPSLSADGRTLVFVNGLADYWTNNDLYMVTLPDDLEQMVEDGLYNAQHTLYLSEPDANPTSDYANISYFFPNDTDKKGELVVSDAKGKEVKRFLLNAKQYNFTLDFSSLPNGEYTYQLWYNGKMAGKHSIKVRK